MSCMNHVNSRSKYGFLFVLILAGGVPGCFPPPPPPESVLSGTWKFTVQNVPDLKQLLVTFDANGNLTTVQYQIGQNASISAPTPVSATNVDGTAITVSATFNRGNTLAFDGTLNSTNDVATGNLTTFIQVGGATIQLNNGAAT